MEKVTLFKTTDLAKITKQRSGEIKFGEKMIIIPKESDIESFLKVSQAKYVLLGIPEDVGIKANNGQAGAASAWESAMQNIANIQHNRFCKGSQIIVLGQIDVTEIMNECENLDFKNIKDRLKMSQLVEQLDKDVSHIIFKIIMAGKIPIIIGGGHNNCYGNIKGSALAKSKPINAINFDARSDFRILEGRHNGNGFSYAFNQGFLNKYFVFGLHENYTSKSVLDLIKKTEQRIKFVTYDSIKIRCEKNFYQELINAYEYITTETFGIEIDLGSIPNIASSSMTLSGFSTEELRQFVNLMGKHKNATYMHICEGAPDLDHNNKNSIGKLIAYLVTDFIKASHSM